MLTFPPVISTINLRLTLSLWPVPEKGLIITEVMVPRDDGDLLGWSRDWRRRANACGRRCPLWRFCGHAYWRGWESKERPSSRCQTMPNLAIDFGWKGGQITEKQNKHQEWWKQKGGTWDARYHHWTLWSYSWVYHQKTREECVLLVVPVEALTPAPTQGMSVHYKTGQQNRAHRAQSTATKESRAKTACTSKISKREITLRDATNAATHSLEKWDVRTIDQYRRLNQQACWGGGKPPDPEGRENKPGNGFRMRRPSKRWTYRQADKGLLLQSLMGKSTVDSPGLQWRR